MGDVQVHEGFRYLPRLFVVRREPVRDEPPAHQTCHDVLAAKH
jgi:hypothetical protein